MRKGPGREVFTIGIYQKSFVTQIFYNGQPSQGGDCKTFSDDFNLSIVISIKQSPVLKGHPFLVLSENFI